LAWCARAPVEAELEAALAGVPAVQPTAATTARARSAFFICYFLLLSVSMLANAEVVGWFLPARCAGGSLHQMERYPSNTN
jgi:hypothetical protein